MATKTLGTNATNTLSALASASGATGGFSLGEHEDGNFTNQTAADFAVLAEAILNDKVNSFPKWPGALTQNGMLYVPNRGILKVLPGDWVGVDASGWPILVSAHAIAYGSTSWTHS